MKYLDMLIIFCTSFPAHSQNEITAWKACVKSEECEVVVQVCGSAGAINRKFLNAYYAYKTEVETKALCSSIVDSAWKQNIEPVCENKKCIVKKKETTAGVKESDKIFLKLKYTEIEADIAKGNYRECFYKALSLKNIVRDYKNLDNHFYFCKQSMK